MLGDCFASLVRQAIPDWDHRIVVVENEPARMCARRSRASRKQGLPVPSTRTTAGHPVCLNAAVEEALECGADWIGFVDDDEAVDAGWLSSITRA